MKQLYGSSYYLSVNLKPNLKIFFWMNIIQQAKFMIIIFPNFNVLYWLLWSFNIQIILL